MCPICWGVWPLNPELPKAEQAQSCSSLSWKAQRFFSILSHWNETNSFEMFSQSTQKEREREKDPFLLPFPHIHNPLVAISPGDSDINLGSFAQADPEQSPSPSFCVFSCALIMPKCRAFCLFFSPFLPSSNSVLKITQQELQWRNTLCENLSCGKPTFSNRGEKKIFPSETHSLLQHQDSRGSQL